MSLFRKFLKSNPKDDGTSGVNQFARPTSIQAMGPSLQRKFAKGVQYNMKIVIRGDRNVGKSCLFERLQGGSFKEEYIPTDEIQVACIHWNHKTIDDVVKVEVWDIVDKGRKKRRSEGLKLENEVHTTEEPILDAEFLDVYKGTHGVLLLLDMTKSWTFDYVQRELPRVPDNIPVLVLANHRDMGHHRTVTADQVKTFLESLDRPPDAAQIRYTESSMRTAFGLKYVHRFFSLPFLQLQRETLLSQLNVNSRDIGAVAEELDCMDESEESNYEAFCAQLSASRIRPGSAATSPTSPPDPGRSPTLAQPPAPEKSPRLHAPPARPIPGMEAYLRGVGQPSAVPPPPPPPPPQSAPGGGQAEKVNGAATAAATTPEPIPEESPKRSKAAKSPPKPSPEAVIPRPEVRPTPLGGREAVEDFVPADEAAGLSSFLEEAKEVTNDFRLDSKEEEESSSEEESLGANPMVADFKEDLDSEDERPVASSQLRVPASRHLQLSSDDEEEEEEEEAEVALTVPQMSTGQAAVPAGGKAAGREPSSSGYTSASSEKPAGLHSASAAADGGEAGPTGDAKREPPQGLPPHAGDLDSSEEEEKARGCPAGAPPVDEAKEEEDEEEEEEEEEVAQETPVLQLDTDDLDFLEKRGSLPKTEPEIVSSESIVKKPHKKQRKEKEDEDSEKRKSKKHKARKSAASSAESEESSKRSSRKKGSRKGLEEAPGPDPGKKSKKKSKKRATRDADDGFGAGDDLERFLNDAPSGGGGGGTGYEML